MADVWRIIHELSGHVDLGVQLCRLVSISFGIVVPGLD
jgi:hypothetical protein